MNKEQRKQIFNKYNGHCAYCGRELELMQADHIVPIYRDCGKTKKEVEDLNVMENFNPSCPRCNMRKSVLSIEAFRHELELQVDRLRIASGAFRLAEDFGLIKQVKTKVEFHFERIKDRDCGKTKKEIEDLNVMENFNPSCLRCNMRKSVLSLEAFRHELELKVDRQRRYLMKYEKEK